MTLPSVTRNAKAGEVIFSEGEAGDCAYIVEQGQVEISTSTGGARRVLCVMGPGMIFGEMAILDDVVRSADARVAENAKLVVISREQLRSRLEDADPITRLLLSVILERFRREIRLFRAPAADALVAEGGMRTDVFFPDAVEKMKLEGELRSAITHGELELHFQPLVALGTGVVTGFEALVRWRHPERGLISPAMFVPLAEESALIIPMGQWVLEHGCKWLKRFREVAGKAGPTDLDVAVNVSGRQFAEPGFFDSLKDVVAREGVEAQHLKLEITEGVLLDYADAPAWMEQCKAAGFRMCLDDFGTGYSSLGYLHRFPTDVLKVDRSFVASMINNARSMAVVTAVVGLAAGLGMTVVAEGVEGVEEARVLRGLGCQLGQGYYFSKPVPPEEAMGLIGRTMAL